MPHALIVEDNARNLHVISNLLNQEGITHTDILVSEELPSVIATLDTPDVVFLDLEMPGLNGYDVLALLKSVQAFAKVPVVAYTVHVSESKHAYEMGFHSFLGKPLDPDRFSEQIASILRGEAVWETT